MDKLVASPAAAIADLQDGATIVLGGFGQQFNWPVDLIRAVRAKGTKDLTVVSAGMGSTTEIAGGQHLVESRQVKKIIASFTLRTGIRTPSEEQVASGELQAELVPQGMLVERARAGGAGIPAFYSPAGAGTAIAEGKEVRHFDGRPYVLEQAITADFAFVRAWRADRAGNLAFRGTTRNMNVAFAKCARITVAEVDEIVDTGQLAPEDIHLPGIFVTRVIRTTQSVSEVAPRPSRRRTAEAARLYNGKPGLTRTGIARRAAALIREGSTVNLGSGIPELLSNHLEGRDVLLHAENGMLGYGGILTGDAINPRVANAGAAFVATVPGASFFDSVTSFEMGRGGHLDGVVLGAYEVDEQANLANWTFAQPLIPNLGGVGGAMDLVAGRAPLIVVMEHHDSQGRHKLRERCTLPLTARACVNWVVTDLALLRWNGSGFVLEEVAPGFSAEEVQALTEMRLELQASVGRME